MDKDKVLYYSAIAGIFSCFLTYLIFFTGKNNLKDFLSSLYSNVEVVEESNANNNDVIVQQVRVYATGKDGFLSLRAKPSIHSEELTRIPHQTKISIFNCQSIIKNDSTGNSGHWCECEYNSMRGWIFDAYIKK